MNDSERAQIVAKVGEPRHRIDWRARGLRVAELVKEGFSWSQIGKLLDVSPSTAHYWYIGRQRRADRVAAERDYREEQAE